MNKPHMNTIQYLAITQAKYLNVKNFYAIHYSRIKRIFVFLKVVIVCLFIKKKLSLVVGNTKFKEFALIQKILGNKLNNITLVLDFYNESIESLSTIVRENGKIHKIVVLGNVDLLIGLKQHLKDARVTVEFVEEKARAMTISHRSILSIKPLYQFRLKHQYRLIKDAISIRIKTPELTVTFHPRISRISVFVWQFTLGYPLKISDVNNVEFDSCVFFGAYSNFILSAKPSNTICLSDLSSHPQYDKFMDVYYSKEGYL